MSYYIFNLILATVRIPKYMEIQWMYDSYLLTLWFYHARNLEHLKNVSKLAKIRTRLSKNSNIDKRSLEQLNSLHLPNLVLWCPIVRSKQRGWFSVSYIHLPLVFVDIVYWGRSLGCRQVCSSLSSNAVLLNKPSYNQNDPTLS